MDKVPGMSGPYFNSCYMSKYVCVHMYILSAYLLLFVCVLTCSYPMFSAVCHSLPLTGILTIIRLTAVIWMWDIMYITFIECRYSSTQDSISQSTRTSLNRACVYWCIVNSQTSLRDWSYLNFDHIKFVFVQPQTIFACLECWALPEKLCS